MVLQNVIPYVVLYLIFGLMWWLREIVIVNEDVWGEIEHSASVVPGLEASCGWASLGNSHSGRLQVNLMCFPCQAMSGLVCVSSIMILSSIKLKFMLLRHLSASMIQ